MSEKIRKILPAESSSHKFTITTKQMQDYGVETPVCGATELVTVKDGAGRLEVFSIGSDGYLYQLRRDGFDGSHWRLRRLPWRARALAAVPQRDGTDRVYFLDMKGERTSLTSVYELVPTQDGRLRKSRRGRLSTTDPRVYGVSGLAGVETSDGSNVLVTALAAHPPGAASNWVLVFRERRGFGALSTAETHGVVATRVVVASPEPGSAEWPGIGLAMIYDGGLRLEWGVRSGPLLQTEPVALPSLADAADLAVVTDGAGRLRLFALDTAGRLHVLAQVGTVDGRPVWAPGWTAIDTATAEGERAYLRRVKAVRTGSGDLVVFAVDEEDRLHAVSESPDGWGLIEDLGVEAAHFDAAVDAEGRLELFAVSRSDHFVRLAWGADARPSREIIEWDAASGERKILNVYRTCLAIFNEDDGVAPGVPVYVTASRQVSAVVNGLSYALNPSEPVTIETNAFGKVTVLFEEHGNEPVPSLKFEADFLDGGILDVCPRRKAQVYVESITRDELLSCARSESKMHLIPEDTLILQTCECLP